MVKYITSLWGICLIILSLSCIYDYQLTLVLLVPSFAILVITSIPLFITNEKNLFSPLAYLVYWIFLTVFLRMVYIVHDYPDELFVKIIFLQHNEKLFLLKPLFIMTAGMVLFITGYMFNIHPRSKVIRVTIDNWNRFRVYVISIAMTLIALSATYIFITQNIGSIFSLSMENISNHRGVTNYISDYTASGTTRIFILLAETTFLILYSYNILSPKNDKILIIICAINFSISFFFYFFTQSRSGLMLLIINPLVLSYLLTRKKINVLKWTGVFTIAIVLLSVVTSFRTGVGLEIADFSLKGAQRVIDPLIANNGGYDVSKTALIMDYIDRNETKQFGSTFSWIFTSFIPRSIWPNKPVNIDTYFGMKVYGATTYGSGAVPPGVFAELYWNFGYIGIFIGCFITGMVLRWVNGRYLIYGSNNINGLIIYVFCFMGIGIGLFGSGISSTVVGILYKIIPLIFILKFITKNKKIMI